MTKRKRKKKPTRDDVEQLLEPPGPLWNDEERTAWEPRERILPSTWAERYRVLTPEQSIFATGPYRYDLAPYLRAISDLPAKPGIIQMNGMKSPQVGFSEAIRNFIGWRADTEPSPMGLTLPDREKGRDIIQDRLIPLFKTTPQLARYVGQRKWDIKSGKIKLLNGFILHLMWSGSASSMAANPMLDVVNDEIDKFVRFRFEDADAIDLTGRRQLTGGGRGVQINISTPTTRAGNIWRLIETSDVVLYYFVPCPKCGAMQRLVFEQLRYDPKLKKIEDKYERAAKLVQAAAVWYECIECHAKITEDQRPAMVRAGKWGTLDRTIDDAEAVVSWPRGTRLGLHIWQAYTLWDEHNWTNILAEWIRARGDIMRTMAFKTQVLGEPFESQVSKAEANEFSAKSASATLKEGVIPQWAVALIGTADTQKDHFYLVIRAWGPGRDGMKSQRVWHGRVESFEELHRTCFIQPFPVEEQKYPPQMCHLVLIDTGGTRVEGEDATRTMQVYDWVRRRKARVRAIKGASHRRSGATSTGPLMFWRGTGFLKTGEGRKKSERQGTELPLWMVDTHLCNDMLADLIAQGVDDDEAEEVWLLNKRDDPEYNRHMANMRKIGEPRGTQYEEKWIPISEGARVDFRHCEAYQIAAAHMMKVHLLPRTEEMEQYKAARAERATKARGRAVEKKQQRRRGDDPDGWAIRPLKV